MSKQTSERYDSARGGFGYIIAHHDGREIFFRVRSIEDGGPPIKEGQAVTYELMQGQGGEFYAINIEVVEDDSDLD
ncbi:cold-shock protein [Pseudomonas akapageensis]|uniref:cold-shock protein n=1 Tax=Pseudomonas akapageensis TaxID=2609961 RepID=UPI00140C63F6|nr:cold shock domain-containing protein [Pseudomonas akapageensis]